MVRLFKIIVLSSIHLLFSCRSSSKKNTIDKQIIQVNKMSKKVNTSKIKNQDIDITDLVKIKKRKDAIQRFGNPKSTDFFIMDNAQGEFRIELNNFFSLEERVAENIKINESTWEYSGRKLITIWYQRVADEHTYIHHLLWEDETDF